MALVSMLDDILSAHTGRHINRSYKNSKLQECVRLCFAAVDLKIGGGSIKEAIEVLTSARDVPRLRIKTLSNFGTGFARNSGNVGYLLRVGPRKQAHNGANN